MVRRAQIKQDCGRVVFEVDGYADGSWASYRFYGENVREFLGVYMTFSDAIDDTRAVFRRVFPGIPMYWDYKEVKNV